MKRVVIGLSGGVDSSVAAYLLKQQGYDVAGLFMINWHDTTGTLEGDCPWHDDRTFAELVAKRLDIPLHVVDLSEHYRKRVVDYMFAEYERGRTPNPDVLCNREIKFDVFLKEALRLGADYVATGHYCRKDETTAPDGRTVYRLLAGSDPNKDQSYFLCQLSQEQLRYALFPVGGLLKPEVRRIAEEQRLATAKRKDSQGICFVGKVDLPVFLQQKLASRTGNVHEILPSWPKYAARPDIRHSAAPSPASPDGTCPDPRLAVRENRPAGFPNGTPSAPRTDPQKDAPIGAYPCSPLGIRPDPQNDPQNGLPTGTQTASPHDTSTGKRHGSLSDNPSAVLRPAERTAAQPLSAEHPETCGAMPSGAFSAPAAPGGHRGGTGQTGQSGRIGTSASGEFTSAELAALAEPWHYTVRDGRKIGTHNGAHFYTIGQRKGLGIGGRKESLFVLATDVEQNVIYVGEGDAHPGLHRRALFIRANEIHWVDPLRRLGAGQQARFAVRIRYRQPLQGAELIVRDEGAYLLFDQPQRGITAGQFAAWYDGDELVGSGVIDR